VAEGTANADTVWMLTTNDPITLATTALTFNQLGGTVSGSGTSGNYAKFTGTTAIGNSNLTEAGSPTLVQTNTANFQVTQASTGVALTISNSIGVPSAFDNWQIALYTSGGGPSASYGFGVETNFLWYQGENGHKWYIGGTAKWNITSTFEFAPVTDNNVDIGSSTKGVKTYYLPGGIKWLSGAGTPEGAVSAPVGSLYSRSDGGAGTSLYVKESGSGNTGWVGK